jgi:hypothetical protein
MLRNKDINEKVEGTFDIRRRKVVLHHASAFWLALALGTDHVSWEIGRT